MRKALIVGIDYYEIVDNLNGCVNDANRVNAVLERDFDGTVNFTTPKLLTGTGPSATVDRATLRDAVKELFRDESDIALFYFSGHGYHEDAGGFLCTSEASSGDDGLSLSDVMTFANASPAKNKVIILDSCHSGAAAQNLAGGTQADIREGVTILSASAANQYAMESNGAGIFTSLLIDALSGAAANLVGQITPGSVYAHIDQALGPWSQRPVFKTNVKSFVSLRKTAPPISLSELQQLSTIFKTPGNPLPLDPSYEPKRSAEELADPDIPAPDPAKNAVFRILQNYVKVNLVRPVGEEHMYFAAMESKACELTVLGEHYWDLVDRKLI